MDNTRRKRQKPESHEPRSHISTGSRKRRQQSSPDLEALLRKGLFLRRMFARPRLPLVDASGNPTSLALSVRRYGEPVPKTAADANRLAKKGLEILDQYHAVKAELKLRAAA
jgi:hypothetical protein